MADASDVQVIHEKRKPTVWQIIVQAILPAVIVLLLAWGAEKVATMDKTLAVVATTVAGIKEKLDEHQQITKEVMNKTSELHHNRRMKTPCTGCHIHTRD